MKPTYPAVAITHWLARVAAIALSGFFLLFYFGEGPPRLPIQPLDVQLIFVGWAAIFLGYAIGWFRPIAGGALVLLALAGMNAVQWAFNGALLGPWLLLWGAPGLLYLIAGWLKRRPARSPNRPVATSAA